MSNRFTCAVQVVPHPPSLLRARGRVAVWGATMLGLVFVLGLGAQSIQPGHFAELFDAGDNDLDFQAWTFTPNASLTSYTACREPATAFPTDPAGGTTVSLSDDSYTQVTLAATRTVAIYGQRTNVFFIGSNGYLTMSVGDSSLGESFSSHFNLPRVSACFDDLNPGSAGTVSWKQTADRVAVTFSNVVEFGGTATVSFQIEMFYDGRIRITYLNVGITDGLAGLSAGTGIPSGFVETDLTSLGPCASPITVTVPGAATEGDGVLASAGAIRLFVPLATNLLVSLTASPAGEVLVSDVMVPAGQTTVAFDLSVVDDDLLDGTRPVMIAASAPGHSAVPALINIHDNETAALSLELPDFATEGDSPGAARIYVSAPPGRDLSVALSSSDETEIQVPAVVLVPAGQTSAEFNITILDDTLIDGAQTVVVRAHVQNWADSAWEIEVQDNESLDLTVTLPGSAYESAGVLTNQGSVQLAGTLPTSVLVSLSSSDTTELSVPFTVTIPANQFSVTFNLRMLDDMLVDGAQDVTVTAQAVGFTDGLAIVRVMDDETPPVPEYPSPGNLAADVSSAEDLAWTLASLPGQVITCDVYFGTNPVPGDAEYLGSTTNRNWPLPQLTPFTTYYWQVVARRIGTTPGPIWQFTTRGVDHFDWSAVASRQLVGTNFPVTLIARDDFNAVVSNFNGAVSLSGRGAGGQAMARMLEGAVPHGTGSGMYTWGYLFTPTNNLWVTHLRHYFGTKVSLWTGTGELLASRTVVSPAGGWTETSLDTPVSLVAGSNYLVAAYVPGDSFSWVTNLASAFPDGIISQSRFAGSDTFPTTLTTGAWPMVGLRYSTAAALPITIAPTNTGAFVNGTWTGSISILESSTNMVLVAADSSGHQGVSASFETVHANDLLVAAQDQPDPVVVSALLTNVFTVENTGPGLADGVTATHVVPPSLALVSATASQGSCVVVGDRVDCALGTLAGGASATLRVVTMPAAPGQVTNRVVVGRLGADGDPDNNSATSVTTVLLPSLSVADVSVAEGDTNTTDAVFHVILQPASPVTVTVAYATADGTALAGSDYLPVSGVLSFAPGETDKSVVVPVIGDTTGELLETFLLTLSQPVNALLARAQATGTIPADDNGEPAPFQIAGLFTNNSVVVDHDSLTGDDRGGIALSSSRVFVTGDGSTAHFNIDDLAGGTRLNVVRDGLCSDLRSETVYLLGNGATPLTSSGGTVTTLIELDAVGQPSGVVLQLSQSITMTSYGSGIFSGYGRVVLYNGSRVYDIYVPSGFVTDRGAMSRPSWYSSESWANWGVAEYFGNTLYLTGRESGSQRITRVRVPDGAVTVLATFNNLADMASLIVSPSRNRWYFHYEGGGQFGGSSETLGYADAAFISDEPPRIVVQPASRSVIPGGSVTFCVTSAGSAPLSYQWRKDGTNLVNGGRVAGATNSCLTLSNAIETDSGLYSVLISNPNGSAVSSNATLLVSRADHFAWNPIPSPQRDQVPFTAIITAMDSLNRRVMNYNGNVALSASTLRTNLVGTNTTMLTFPLGTSYHDERTQVIYQQAEVGGAGRIVSLSLDVATRPTQFLNAFTIRMKHTPLSNYSSFLWENSGWTVVCQTNLSIISTGWVNFAFSVPFEYNGTSGLMIDFSFNNASRTADGLCRATSRSGIRTIFYRTDSTNGDPLTWSGSSPSPSLSTYTPNLRLMLDVDHPAQVNPTVVCFTNGLWNGPLTVLSLATNLILRAADSFGHFGYSTPIRVLGTPPAFMVQPTNLLVAVGESATFCSDVRGTAPLTLQWWRDAAPILGATQACYTLENAQVADSGGRFSCLASNAYGVTHSAEAELRVNRPPIADASATARLLIAPNGVATLAVLDGSRSSDPDGDPLAWLWRSSPDSTPVATGRVAVVMLPLGSHLLDLVVSDGFADAIDSFTVTVLSPSEGVQRVIETVQASGWSRARPLLASLEAAQAAILRGNLTAAINQLHAFQSKVRVQVAPEDPVLADALIRAAQMVIDALCGGSTPEVPTLQGVERQPGGKVKFKVNAAACWIQLVEASANMVDWEVIGVLTDQPDGTFEFVDPDAAKFPGRFYRIRQLAR